MRTFSVVSAAATVLTGASLLASVVKADLDPIVIKVRGYESHSNSSARH